MGGGDATKSTCLDFSRHESELGAVDGDGSAPEAEVFLEGEAKEFLPGGEGVGDGLFAPDVAAGFKGLAVEALMFLHVGEVHEEFEGRAGEHFVHMRIMMGNLEALGLLLSAFGADIAKADEFDVGGFGEDGQIGMRDAAAANDAGFDAAGLALGEEGRGNKCESGTEREGGFGEGATVQTRWLSGHAGRVSERAKFATRMKADPKPSRPKGEKFGTDPSGWIRP